MKKLIVNALCKGYYAGTKYTAEDFFKVLYILKYVFEGGAVFNLQIKNNLPWSREQRVALISDINKVHNFSIKDTYYFHIINRFENGDGYGLKISEK